MADPRISVLLGSRNLQIGNICFQWAHLEYLIALAIWSFLRIDQETGKILTGGLDILPRTNLAIRLAEHLKAPDLTKKALKTVRTQLQDGLLDKRNRAIHGHRLIDLEHPNTEFVEMHRGKNAGKKLPQTNQDLAQLGKDIAVVHKGLHKALIASGVLHAERSVPARIIAP